MLDALMSRSAQSQQISVSSPEISKKNCVRAPPLFLCESGLGVAGGGLRPFRRRPA